MKTMALILMLLGAPLYACTETKIICYVIGDPMSAETEKSFKEQVEYMESKGWEKEGDEIKCAVPKPKYQSYEEYNLCQKMTRKK